MTPVHADIDVKQLNPFSQTVSQYIHGSSTGRLQSTRSQETRHDQATKQRQTIIQF